MTIANSPVRTGYFVGLGAAINVSLGWIPRRVELFNVTDGTVAAIGFPNKMIAFTSGGVAVPAAGMTILGVTSKAKAKLRDVILVSGSYAAGTAAGFFVADADECVGTFGAENVTLNGSAAGNDDATVVAAVEHSLYQSAALGFVSGSGNTGITSFIGSATAAKGFSVGLTIAANGKLIRWTAFRE